MELLCDSDASSGSPFLLSPALYSPLDWVLIRCFVHLMGNYCSCNLGDDSEIYRYLTECWSE